MLPLLQVAWKGLMCINTEKSTAPFWGQFCYHPHFTHEKTEALGGSVPVWGYVACVSGRAGIKACTLVPEPRLLISPPAVCLQVTVLGFLSKGGKDRVEGKMQRISTNTGPSAAAQECAGFGGWHPRKRAQLSGKEELILQRWLAFPLTRHYFPLKGVLP